METQSQQPINAGQVSVFGEFLRYVEKHGILKTLAYIFVFLVFSIISYIAVSPNVLFEKYEKYVTERHNQSTEYRMASAPLVRNYLNQLCLETGTDRAYIIEYHNGKSNPTGLQWQYGDMTFINDNTNDIRDEFQNISLVKYQIFYELHENGVWFGNMEELETVDKRFAVRAEINDVVNAGFIILYSSDLTEIGVLGISFLDDESVAEDNMIRVMRKYTTCLSPLLDGSMALENKGKIKK